MCAKWGRIAYKNFFSFWVIYSTRKYYLITSKQKISFILCPISQYTIPTTASSSTVSLTSPSSMISYRRTSSPAITKHIQCDTLRPSNKSYTYETLKQLHSNVVYTCQIDDNKGPYIYILLEQQTTPVPLLPFRFLKSDSHHR